MTLKTLLHTFGPAANVAVFGASGGLGAEFVRRLAADPGVGRVLALSRTEISGQSEKLRSLEVDICNEESMSKAAAAAKDFAPFDLVIVATGILHADGIQPEKRLQDIAVDNMQQLFRVNTIGPALVVKHFLPLMRKGRKSVFAALSARVGSIGDNRLGGWVSYRASKAALNMILKTAAVEHRRRFPDSVVVGLHPGTVDTSLSAPFQRNVPDGKLFAPAFAVERLLGVIDTVTPADSGGFFAWDGQSIPY